MSNTLTVTTLALSSVPTLIDNLQQWKTISRTVVALVSTLDARSNPDLLATLTLNAIDIQLYQPTQLFKTPSLHQVISVFHSYPKHLFYSFVNADIEINPLLLSDSLSLVQSSHHILFASRQDYSHTQEPTTYYQGFDYFLIPSCLLCHFTQSSLHKFYIGQVGWDYYLPLSLPKPIVQFSYNLPIYHSLHPSGSHASWADAIVAIYPEIHHSWFTSQRYYRRTVTAICSLLFFFSLRLTFWLPSLRTPTNYLLSRIIFYGLLNPLLRKNTKPLVRPDS